MTVQPDQHTRRSSLPRIISASFTSATLTEIVVQNKNGTSLETVVFQIGDKNAQYIEK